MENVYVLPAPSHAAPYLTCTLTICSRRAEIQLLYFFCRVRVCLGFLACVIKFIELDRSGLIKNTNVYVQPRTAS